MIGFFLTIWAAMFSYSLRSVFSEEIISQLLLGCNVEIKLDNGNHHGDQSRSVCNILCNGRSVDVAGKLFMDSEKFQPRKIFYRSNEIDEAFNKVVELNIKEDGSVDCSLVNVSEHFGSFNSFGMLMPHHPSLLNEKKSLITKSVKTQPTKQCGDDDYEYFEDIDWCVKINSKLQRWKNVQLACASEGGSFAVIDTPGKDRAVQKLLGKKNIEEAWIGLSDTKKSGSVQWIDGTPVTFQRWRKGEPNNLGDEYCVNYEWKKVNFHWEYAWNDISCNNFFPYLCEKKNTSTIVTSVSEINSGIPVCPLGWYKSSTSALCYHIGNERNTFGNALTYCLEQGSNLAFIHHKEEMQFIKGLLSSKLIDGVWIGLTDVFMEDDFKWLDGSALSFVSWKSGEPNNYENTKGQDCVTSEKKNNYDWNDEDCARALRPLCMKRPEFLPMPMYVKGCPSGSILVQNLTDFFDPEMKCPVNGSKSLLCLPINVDGGQGTTVYFTSLVVVSWIASLLLALLVGVAFYLFKVNKKKESQMILEHLENVKNVNQPSPYVIPPPHRPTSENGNEEYSIYIVNESYDEPSYE